MSRPVVTVQQRGRKAVTLKRDGKPIAPGDIKSGQTIIFDAMTGEIYPKRKRPKNTKKPGNP